MKKRIWTIIVCMLLITTVLSVSGTVIVERTPISTSLGDTLYVGGSGPGNYSTIQEAIDDASDGDTIYVYSGTYFEDVKINTSIVLQGEDKESTIIHGGGFGSGDAVVFVSADNVEITGFSISNSCPYWPGSGIGLYSNEQCIVTDNIVSDCFLGINAFITSDATISMNTVSDSEIGIHVQASKRNTITRNTMQDNHRGMYLNGASFNEITENNFINNERHFDFYGVFRNKINENYWERFANIGPKLILGKLFLLIPLPGFIVDWHPAKEPFEFGGEYTEQSEAVYEDPLSFRVEFVKLYDRVWRINGYATNTFDEEITVRWGCPPCVFAFFYPIPDEDLNLLVGQYRTNFYHLKYYNKWFDFEPGEEKLIDSKLFFGISNHFIYGLSKGYQQYFDSWPILPDSDYEVRASLSPYQNENYEMISMGVQETLIFQYS